MTEKTTIERIKEILVEELGVNPEQVTYDVTFIEDLGCDSLDILELVMAIEDEFNLEIPDEDAEKICTVGDAVKYIEDPPSSRSRGTTSGQGRSPA